MTSQEMRELVPDARTRELLLAFWELRGLVTTEAGRCPVPLWRKDGTMTRCVLPRAHLRGEELRANVPHASEEGFLAPLGISWEALAEARRISRLDAG